VIVSRVRVHPFGCFLDREIAFSPGLNVLLGPNEAGKSTLFHAIRHALFVPTKLSRPGLAKYVAPHLPLTGGDSLRVELSLATSEGSWTVKRQWGASAGSALILPTGATLSDDGAILQRLSELLPAKPGAVSHILMISQSELSETLASLRDEARDSLSDLADILRRAVLDTGGVSVDRFLGRLREQISAAFSHWDQAAQGPEKNRGIENPWVKEVGIVLKAYYQAERARAAWKSAVHYEAGLDEVNEKLRVTAGALAKREAFITAHVDAVRDARERRTREAELGACRAEAAALRAAAAEWPVQELTARSLQSAMAAAESARAPLEKEVQAARRAEEGRGLREKHARVMKRAAQADEARKRLAAVPPLEKKGLEDLRRAAQSLEKLEAGREAGMLSVTVASRADVEIVVQEDFLPESRRKLANGETARLRAGGRVRIVHPEMEVEVRSGDADAEARAEKAAAARRSLDELLACHGVADLTEAEERFRAREALAAEEAAARKSLAEELAGDTVESLQAGVAALGTEEQTRSLSLIASELATLTAQGEARSRELAEARRRIQEWATAYDTQEKLMDRLAAVRAREKDCAERIAHSVPLPAGFADAAEFVKAFETAQEELANLRVDLKGLERDKHALEDRLTERAADQSAEELAVQVKDAEEDLQSALRRGQALQRIEAACERLLGQGESSLFDAMRAQLEQTLSLMTDGRHARVEMEGSLPMALADGPGRSAAWELLSAGTKDSLALALRLAMAGYFLGGSDGFLMMDDPLVDMDPARQKAAAEALKSFAAGRQIIFFTCHPGTADLLGGNLIRM
jgi:exonuclease SbcC